MNGRISSLTDLVERGEEPGDHGFAQSQRAGEKVVRGLLGSSKYFLGTLSKPMGRVVKTVCI